MSLRNKLRAVGLSLLLCAMGACASEAAEPITKTAPPQLPWPEVAPIYQHFRTGVLTEDIAGLRARLPISQISLVSSGCDGPCPEYAFHVQRDSGATFLGSKLVGRLKGNLEGSVYLDQYAELCLFIERLRFRELAPSYNAPDPHKNTITLSVWFTGEAEPVVVTDCGESGPPELLMLVIALESLIMDINWTLI